MDVLNRLFSFLAGESWDVIKSEPSISKNKIITQGGLMLIPITIYFVIGFTLSSTYFDKGFLGSIFTGLFFAFIIFLVDRSILLLKPAAGLAKFFNYFFRILLSVILSLLGALFIDIPIFKNDILKYQHEKMIKEKNIIINNLDAETKRAQQVWFCEMNGCKGGKPHHLFPNGCPVGNEVGHGEKSKLKEREYREKNKKLEIEKSNLQSLSTGNQGLEFGDSAGLLYHVSALWELKKEKPIIGAVTLFIILAILMIEILFLINKTTCRTTSYERKQIVKEKEQDQVVEMKEQQILEWKKNPKTYNVAQKWKNRLLENNKNKRNAA